MNDLQSHICWAWDYVRSYGQGEWLRAMKNGLKCLNVGLIGNNSVAQATQSYKENSGFNFDSMLELTNQKS